MPKWDVSGEYRIQRRWARPKLALRRALLNCVLDVITNNMAGRHRFPAWYLRLRR